MHKMMHIFEIYESELAVGKTTDQNQEWLKCYMISWPIQTGIDPST